MKCSNCDASADYLLDDPGVNPVAVCAGHMPVHWMDRVIAGHFPLLPK